MAKNLEMDANQVVNLLLNKENEITNKFHNTITDILRLEDNSDRAKELVTDLIESVQYSLEEIERIVNR